MVLPLSAVIGERAKRAKLAVRVSMVLEFWCVFNPPCGCVYARLVVDVVLKHSRWFRSKSDGRDLMRFDAAELLMIYYEATRSLLVCEQQCTLGGTTAGVLIFPFADPGQTGGMRIHYSPKNVAPDGGGEMIDGIFPRGEVLLSVRSGRGGTNWILCVLVDTVSSAQAVGFSPSFRYKLLVASLAATYRPCDV